jgi:hypothetical protein
MATASARQWRRSRPQEWSKLDFAELERIGDTQDPVFGYRLGAVRRRPESILEFACLFVGEFDGDGSGRI